MLQADISHGDYETYVLMLEEIQGCDQGKYLQRVAALNSQVPEILRQF
jgi:hypothetical protein